MPYLGTDGKQQQLTMRTSPFPVGYQSSPTNRSSNAKLCSYPTWRGTRLEDGIRLELMCASSLNISKNATGKVTGKNATFGPPSLKSWRVKSSGYTRTAATSTLKLYILISVMYTQYLSFCSFLLSEENRLELIFAYRLGPRAQP